MTKRIKALKYLMQHIIEVQEKCNKKLNEIDILYVLAHPKNSSEELSKSLNKKG